MINDNDMESINNVTVQPQSEFIPSGQMASTGRLGWTTEFHLHDLETGK